MKYGMTNCRTRLLQIGFTPILASEGRPMLIFGISTQALFGHVLIGLINGAFYSMLSLGLAVIFGLLNIINLVHGALYMLGAFVTWMLLNYVGADRKSTRLNSRH